MPAYRSSVATRFPGSSTNSGPPSPVIRTLFWLKPPTVRARHREGLARPSYVWHAVIDDSARALCGVDVAVPYETSCVDPSRGEAICAICGDAALGWRRGVGAASDGGELPPVR